MRPAGARERGAAEPLESARPTRAKLGLKGELALALLPTLTVLAMLALVEAFSHHRLLFTSLASSAFLIYLDPQHEMNATKTLVLSHLGAVAIGLLADAAFGPGYLAAGSAMVLTVLLMVVSGTMHPPAVATSLTFTFQAGTEPLVLPFGLAMLIVAALALLKRGATWVLHRLNP